MTTLKLPYPPTVNHYFSVIRGRPVLSKDARVYRQLVRQCVRSSGTSVSLGPLALRLELFPPDGRRRDCDNAQKPILDALQQAGAFVDDSQIVWLLTVKFAAVPGGKAVVRIWSVGDGLPPATFIQPLPMEMTS
jgi:crossover junction endodeoxyribonuclease RusA